MDRDGQASLTNARKRRLTKLLSQLRQKNCFVYFLEPVDVVKFDCKDYYDVVRYPMDLQTMEVRTCVFGTFRVLLLFESTLVLRVHVQAKVDSAYRTEQDFWDEMMRIFSNCEL
jgi:hypothetical protein